MCVEKAFGILKGRWRVIMKRCEIHLSNVPDIVATYVVLHNLYIITKEDIEQNLIVEAKKKLTR